MIHTGSQVVVKTVRAGVLGGFPNLKASMSYLADELMGRKRARKIERSATPSRTAERPASGPEPVSQPSYRGGDAGFNWMYVGLGALVAGGVGFGVLLLQNGSGGDTGPGNSGPGTGQLPGPPTFP